MGRGIVWAPGWLTPVTRLTPAKSPVSRACLAHGWPVEAPGDHRGVAREQRAMSLPPKPERVKTTTNAD